MWQLFACRRPPGILHAEAPQIRHSGPQEKPRAGLSQVAAVDRCLQLARREEGVHGGHILPAPQCCLSTFGAIISSLSLAWNGQPWLFPQYPFVVFFPAVVVFWIAKWLINQQNNAFGTLRRNHISLIICVLRFAFWEAITCHGQICLAVDFDDNWKWQLENVNS